MLRRDMRSSWLQRRAEPEANDCSLIIIVTRMQIGMITLQRWSSWRCMKKPYVSDDTLSERKLRHGGANRSLPASQRTKGGKFSLCVVLPPLISGFPDRPSRDAGFNSQPPRPRTTFHLSELISRWQLLRGITQWRTRTDWGRRGLFTISCTKYSSTQSENICFLF